ncbi:MAG: hypothetical protein ABFD20_08810 [Anaerolineales bacterium]
MTENQAAAPELPRRVVEFELRRPEINVPHIDIEPVRRLAEDVLLTGIGVVVLSGRAIAEAVKAANAAGAEAAEHPGPLTRALLSLVRPAAKPCTTGGKFAVLPVSDYDSRSLEDLIALLPDLSREEIELLLAYEREHQAREAFIAALTARLA